MAGYLIAVNYKVNGVSHQVLLGIDDGLYPDQATAISSAISTVTNFKANKGEAITNVAALVSATR